MKRFAAFILLLWTLAWWGVGVYGAARAPGAASVQGSVDAGQPVSGWPLLVGGEDGSGNAQYLATDATGKLIVSPNSSTSSITLGSRVTAGDTQINATTSPTRALGVSQADGNFSFPDGQALLQNIPIGLTSLNTLYYPVRPEIYNGATMDKVRSVGGAADASTTGIVAQGEYGYNGATWDRARNVAGAVNTTGVGLMASGNMLFDSTNWQRQGGVTNYADASNLNGGNTQAAAVALWAYNGATWDRPRTNAAAPTTAYRMAVSPGTGPMTSLAAAAATGPGASFNLGTACANFTVQITATGAPTTYTINLQESLDGTTWINAAPTPINQTNTPTLPALVAFANIPAPFVRLNLNTLAGGASPTITGILCGY